MLNTKTKREKLILRIGILSIFAFVCIKFVAIPLYEGNKLNIEQIDNKTTFLNKYKEILNQKELYEKKKIETGRINELVKESFLDAPKPDLAAAILQNILEDQAVRASVKITRSKIDKFRTDEEVSIVPVEITLRSNLKNLSRFIQFVENHSKILIIEDFSSRRVNRNDPELLETRLQVNGLIQPMVNEETKGI
jgi:Tfp pilus assembly protein PilO